MGFRLLTMRAMAKRPHTHTVPRENVQKYNTFGIVWPEFSQGDVRKRGDAVYFTCHSCLMGLSLWEKSRPYHQRADKGPARRPLYFPHVTGPTLHLPYLPSISGSLLSWVCHCVSSCRSCYLQPIQFRTNVLSSWFVVCAVKLFITLLCLLCHQAFPFTLIPSIRSGCWAFINLWGSLTFSRSIKPPWIDKMATSKGVQLCPLYITL